MRACPCLTALALALTLAACGSDAERSEAKPEDVDAEAPASVTEDEQHSFRAPSDSLLTEAQVTAFLKTSLLQFDLIRKESAGWHEKMQQVEERQEKGGTLGQLRNLATAGSTIMQMSDVVGGSYVRSARALGYNPAEMEWVRDRMAEVNTHLAALSMQETTRESARQMREQAEELRRQAAAGAAGFSSSDIDRMLASADEMEAAGRVAGGAAQRNSELLHRAKPNVTAPMWSTISMASGAMGLAAFGGLGEPQDTTAQGKLDELRRIYEDALANRASPGMEAERVGG